MKEPGGTETWCLLSSTDSALHFELLQPLGVLKAGGGGGEEQAGKQCQDEDKPLGIHREGTGVEVLASK